MARPGQKEKHLIQRYKELVWFLDSLDFDGPEIGIMVNRDKSTISRILEQKPKDWVEPFWFK